MNLCSRFTDQLKDQSICFVAEKEKFPAFQINVQALSKLSCKSLIKVILFHKHFLKKFAAR